MEKDGYNKMEYFNERGIVIDYYIQRTDKNKSPRKRYIIIPRNYYTNEKWNDIREETKNSYLEENQKKLISYVEDKVISSYGSSGLENREFIFRDANILGYKKEVNTLMTYKKKLQRLLIRIKEKI